MNEPLPSQPSPSPPLEPLVGVLRAVVEKLREPLYLFVIGISTLLVILVLAMVWIAPEIRGPLYAALIVIGVLALAALAVGAVTAVVDVRKKQAETVQQPPTALQEEATIVKPAAQIEEAPAMTRGESDQVHLTRLRQILAARFDESELRTLCFDLEVDYDDLPGRGKADKGRELVAYLERHGRISDLATVGPRARPDVDWGEAFGMTLEPLPAPSPPPDPFSRVLDFVEGHMTEQEFDAMVVRLLDQGERAGLPRPVTPAGFLDAMRTWGRLDEVRRYLDQKLPARFSG